MKHTLRILLIAALFLSGSVMCEARTTREITYRYQQIWNTAVRFLRVDNGFEIKEQDKETGYLLFAYPDAGRSLTGSVEIIPRVRGNEQYIDVALRIQDMPSYVEVVLIDKLVRKLRNEYGEPPSPRTTAKKVRSASDKEGPKDDETGDDTPEAARKKGKAKDEPEE